jgi:hypothetical protein
MAKFRVENRSLDLRFDVQRHIHAKEQRFFFNLVENIFGLLKLRFLGTPNASGLEAKNSFSSYILTLSKCN